jgi:predicted ester cyclase
MTATPQWRRSSNATDREAQVRHYLDEVFNGHDLTRLDRYLDANLASHWLGDRTLHGLLAWKEAMAAFFAAFPDAAYTLEDIFFSGDEGVWRGTWRATQQGAWEGIAPTGRAATWTVMIMGRFEGDRLVEDWVEYDRYNLSRQLGGV